MKPGDQNKAAILQILQTLFGDGVVAEHRFHPVRRWRFDFAVPEIKLAVEYNGHGGFVKAGGVSRHGSIIGMTGDAEKMNSAIACGWRVLSFTALHFAYKERIRHNLTDVRETIMNVIAGMQEEAEKTDEK
jgi:very-short-patch-repair endonuclease